MKQVPGPWYTRFTRLPLKLATLHGRRIYYVDRLHAKHGPYVRIAPNEIAVSDIEGFQQIHRIGTDFMKSEWYQSLTQQHEKQSILVVTNAKDHSARRRMFARPLSRNSLLENWHDTVRDMSRLAVRQIRETAVKEGKVDVMKWWTLMAMDVVGRLMYGQTFGNLERGTVCLVEATSATTEFNYVEADVDRHRCQK